MDFQNWIEYVHDMAGIYAFDILPDGSFSEIRLMAIKKDPTGLLTNPNAPAFYPGIPWRRYFTDINFESFIYRCASTHNQLYSYVNAHGYWLKGFYLPLDVDSDPTKAPDDALETVYCLYVGSMSPEVEPEFMSQQSSAVSSAVMNISIKLHQTQDFDRAMAAAVGEIRKACGAQGCALYTVDVNRQQCSLLSEHGKCDDMLEEFSKEMHRTPYEIALKWEEDLADSDCLLLENLKVVKERDPVWYQSLCKHDIQNIILYGVRCNQVLVGFIWAANFEADKMIQIKETLELTAFLIGAVISNHQFVQRLEEMSRIDALTQTFTRNAMDARIEQLSQADTMPTSMGIVYADLNGLKTINDDEGHTAGDRLLSKAASLLKIAFGDYEIYRAGGDEFVILCPEIPENRLTKQVGHLRALISATPDVSFAIGTAYSTGGCEIASAMQAADEKMYQDKAEYYRSHPEKDSRNHPKT